MFRRYHNRFGGGGGGGLILCLNKGIPCKFLSNYPIVPNVEIFAVYF